MDAVHLLFSRLPEFTEDLRVPAGKKLRIHSSKMHKNSFYSKNVLHQNIEISNSKSKDLSPSDLSVKSTSYNSDCEDSGISSNLDNASETSVICESNKITMDSILEKNSEIEDSSLSTITMEGNVVSLCESSDFSENIVEMSVENGNMDNLCSLDLNSIREKKDFALEDLQNKDSTVKMYGQVSDKKGSETGECGSVSDNSEDTSTLVSDDVDFVNPRGVRFTLHQSPKDGTGPLTPYSLPCVKELFKLLASLINPHDWRNTDLHIQIGLNLITVALESGVDNVGKYKSLLTFVKDEMCRNLFSLLSSDRLAIFSSCLRIFFLLFEALRTHLKFQLEMFLVKLMEIVSSEYSEISYQQRQMSLDCITSLYRIPGFVTELYINYDCDVYSSNIFEDLSKMLTKNAYPSSGLYSVHLLCLDALLAVVENIENNCQCRILGDKVLQENKSSQIISKDTTNEATLQKNARNIQQIKPNRMKISENLPCHEELMAVKHKKKILASGTEQFNISANKGITFLQEHGLLKSPLDPEEVAAFLRDNPKLNKKMIGEYISNRKNLKVLEAFVRSFSFENTRIDEALRQYLETFRLPGEAPLISLIMEHFAEHYHKSNKEPFANNDAAFTLAYAIIMLNVDQHNHNVKKQNIPMTLEDFKKNLKNVNGGKDFNEDLLEKIYNGIKSEEIVMPAEQTCLVRDNYLWKVLLRRGSSKEGKFIHVPNGMFDHDLFTISWGPTVAALSYVFEKSVDHAIITKTIRGFHKCAMIAAHYKMSDVFDNLIISICKYTTLVNPQNPKNLPILLGSNKKAQMATKAVFHLTNLHRDILREGWRNLLDCIMHLFKAKLLPEDMMEAEDFLCPNGMISLVREDLVSIPKAESGLLSSLYSYITDSPSQRLMTQADEQAKQAALQCIRECHLEQLITESKFYEIDSLQEFVKTLLFLCQCPEPANSPCSISFDEDTSVFVLELLIKIVLLNRDRVSSIYSGIQEHLFRLIMNSALTKKHYLLERSVVGILRVAVRLIRKEHMIPQVLQSLQVILMLKPPSLLLVSRQIAYALHELLRLNAANIHVQHHWTILFCLLERVGAGSKLIWNPSSMSPELQKINTNLQEYPSSDAQSDSELVVRNSSEHNSNLNDRGYTSDSELTLTYSNSPSPKSLQRSESVGSSNQATWIMVTKEGEIESTPTQSSNNSSNQFSIVLDVELAAHDSPAFIKSCESLAFLVRDAAHITAENFESCVHCIRTFVEASANGPSEKRTAKSKFNREKKWSKGSTKRKDDNKIKRSHSQSTQVGEGYDADDDDEEKLQKKYSSEYQQISMQLLDLMHTLHTRASAIFASVPNQKADLWSTCWCPLLQGIACLCCDTRRSIRTSALTLLPRALLVHDLQMLSPVEWESCFNKVLFPLLSKLLEDISPDDPIGIEETRMRSSTLLCKVFLQHLHPLLSLPTFMALWLTILDFMHKYMHADGSGLLAEAIPELLKNMLLVMDTSGVFKKPEDFPGTDKDQMWHITWDRINTFLPGLKDEVFKTSESTVTNAFNPSMGDVPEEVKLLEEINNHTKSENEVCNTVINVEDDISISQPLPISNILPEDSFQTGSPVSVILHPPVTPKENLSASNCPQLVLSSSTISSPVSVPLLLDPAVMSDANVPIFNTQAVPNTTL